MKSVLIALSFVAAVPAFAFNVPAYEGYGQEEATTDYVSWCDKNNVMMVQNDQIVPIADCTAQNLTCRTVRLFRGNSYLVTASCR
ncbi:hypothetical protein [Bdellovibrio sp. HCB288]|uniref:hypothetical protein n=1 Tax=Bdellovibrio sp. HCB288 TaxID=3394355 RepID=UPI0039B62A48